MGTGAKLPADSSLIFMHMPKAAGSSLVPVLLRHYRSSRVFLVDGTDVAASLERLRSLPEEERGRLKLVAGHLRFGVHELLPGRSAYVTILRDPADRIISHYYFVLRNPEHYLHAAVKERSMSLEDYLSAGFEELCDSQARHITGDRDCERSGSDPEALLAEAKRNIEKHFLLVGLSERFDETLVLLKRLLGWRSYPFYVRRNVARRRPPRGEVSAKSLALIEKSNRIDREIYSSAAERLEALIGAGGEGLAREISRFKRLNGMYQKVMSPLVRGKEAAAGLIFAGR